MSKKETGYIIEYKLLGRRHYHRICWGCDEDKQSVMKRAKRNKKDCPELGVRVVEQTRKVLKVL